jgi:hypothetical protein
MIFNENIKFKQKFIENYIPGALFVFKIDFMPSLSSFIMALISYTFQMQFRIEIRYLY